MHFANHSLFIKSKVESMAVLAIYVDNIIITRNNKYEIGKTKAMMKRNFSMKDLGRLQYFFGS